MKRRTIGFSLVMVALVVGMLSIGSWAVFNDTESSETNVLGSGALDLEIGNSADLPIVLDDLKPSAWQYARVVLHNAGNNPGILDLHFANIEDSDIERTGPEMDADPGNQFDDISNWIDVDWCVDPVDDGARDCDGPIIGKLGDLESRVIDLGVQLEPSESVELWLSFHLQTAAGNEYQKDQSTFDVEFTLHQLNLGALGLPAGTTCVRLENKDSSWNPIVGDDLYGSVCYGVDDNGDLLVLVEGHGLAADTDHQLTLNGPHNSVCEATDDQLASGAEQYANYDSGFWDGVGPYINQGSCSGNNNEGIYNFAYVKTDASGYFVTDVLTIANSHEADPADAGKVTTANPSLPRGLYSDVRFIVKEVTGALPGTAWDGKLMEMDVLNFNLP